MITLWVSSSPSVERKHRKLHTVTCHANVVRTHGEIKKTETASAQSTNKSQCHKLVILDILVVSLNR